MRTCAYKVIVEPDEGRWHAYCPALRAYGAVTQGASEEEALKNVNEVVQIIIDELIAEGRPVPAGPAPSPTKFFQFQCPQKRRT
jgi:predicted RNase H-like HicB family nuclease